MKWAKILQNRLRPATSLSPYHAKFYRDWWNHLGEKRYKKFTHFNILAPHGDPLGQRSLFWVLGYINLPSSYLQNYVLFRRPVSEISASKLLGFCCRRDPQKDPQTSASVTGWCMSPQGNIGFRNGSPHSRKCQFMVRPLRYHATTFLVYKRLKRWWMG